MCDECERGILVLGKYFGSSFFLLAKLKGKYLREICLSSRYSIQSQNIYIIFVLILDCTSAPKKWKLGCNSCDVIINIFNKASKVTVNDSKQCDECAAQLVRESRFHALLCPIPFFSCHCLFSFFQVTVVYKADQTKFKDNAEEKTGCLFCSPDFIPLVEKHRAVATKPIQTNSTRGGRGRGNVSVGNGPSRGGGSSRGGRGRPPKDKMAQLAAYFV